MDAVDLGVLIFVVGVVVDDNGLDGVVVDEFSGVIVTIALFSLRLNLGGVVLEGFGERNLDLSCGLGVVKLIEGEEEESREDEEGDLARVLEGGVDATRVLGGGIVSFFKG